MTPQEVYKYSAACFNNGIRIYAKVVNNSGLYKIVIETNGKEKVGSQVYKSEPTKQKRIVKTANGIKHLEEVVPAFHEKVEELYKEIAIRNKYV